MKNLCRALLIAGAVVMSAGFGKMTVKAAATPVYTETDLLDGNGNIAAGEYILQDDIHLTRIRITAGNVTINLNNHKILDYDLDVGVDHTLTIGGTGTIKCLGIAGSVVQNDGTVDSVFMALNGHYEQKGGKVNHLYYSSGSNSNLEYVLTDGTIMDHIELDGQIQLTQNGGTIEGSVTVNGGTLIQNDGTIKGNVTVNSGTFIQNGGRVTRSIINNGGTVTYKITFNPNDGGSSTDSADTGSDGKLTALPADPSWTGHTFFGWYTQASGGSVVTTDTVFGGATTVYAHWQDDATGQITPANPARDTSSKDKKSKHKKHTTPSADYYYNEETGLYGGLIDGVFAPTTMIPASAYPKFNTFLVKKIQSAEAGSTVSVNSEPWTSINKPVADAFTDKGDIAMTFTYKQGEIPYEVTVPAGTNLTEQLDENGYLGFAKMGTLYGAVPVLDFK